MNSTKNPQEHSADLTKEDSSLFTKSLQDKVLPFAKLFQCKQDEAIFLPGSDAHSFCFVKMGTVEVSYTVGETKITVAIIGAGSFFGEIGFFDRGSRVRDIKALEQAEIRIFNQDVMDTLQHAEPLLFSSFMLFLTEGICRKFRKILEEQEPLAAFAASLTNRRRQYEKSKAVPDSLLQSKSWRQINQTVEAFKSDIYDYTHTLQSVAGDDIPEKYIQQGFAILDGVNIALAEFNELMTEQDDRNHMWGFVFKEIFPYVMRSRFAQRAYYKPKGYAGDFLLMEHIYLNNARGDGKIGRLIDRWGLQLSGSEAIRGRRLLLKDQLHALSKKSLEEHKKFSVMNLACGPCRELFDFLEECDYTEKIDALCVDIDTEALQYSNQNVNVFPHKASVRYMTENLVKWALGKVSHDIGLKDMIYSAGLFDYLEPRLFCRLVNRCYDHLKPGGSLLIGNFAPHDGMLFMDHMLHWNLIYRTEDELQELFRDTHFGENITIMAEPEQVNLFVLAHKR